LDFLPSSLPEWTFWVFTTIVVAFVVNLLSNRADRRLGRFGRWWRENSVYRRDFYVAKAANLLQDPQGRVEFRLRRLQIAVNCIGAVLATAILVAVAATVEILAPEPLRSILLLPCLFVGSLTWLLSLIDFLEGYRMGQALRYYEWLRIEKAAADGIQDEWPESLV